MLAGAGEILNNALDKVLEVIQTQAGSMFLLDRMTRDLMLTVCRGAPAELAAEAQRLPLSEGLCGWVAWTGKPRLVADLVAE
ncbi:MAG: GAF domain-containing protein [Anaerolineae bacterium]